MYFVLAFGLTWLIWLLGILATGGLIELPVPFMVFFFLGTWGPFVAASWLTFCGGGRAEVRKFWRRGLNFRISRRWLLIIMGVPLLVSAVPLGVYLLMGGAVPEDALMSRPWMIIPVFITYFLTGGGNEEWGWRGYALDRLQERWDPFSASIVLGLIWGCWHAPLFFIEYTGQYHMSLPLFIIGTVGMSVIHTWVYNKTGRSLFAAWLLHAVFGTVWAVFPMVQPQFEGYRHMQIYDFTSVLVVALIVAGATRFRLGVVTGD